ncbi:MAG TPA: ABC transporter permease [Chloroflexia bacterium]|nr:ABC transporter permease [Chloroflexia bacterium]
MKILDIALKDMLESFRSIFAVMMMFVMPLLITALFYFAFGGFTTNPDLAVTKVQLVNLDKPGAQSGGVNAGQSLVNFLKDARLAQIIQVTEVSSPASARAAVENRQAALALILPADFSSALMSGKSDTGIIIYKDPTLTLGPNIVKGLVSQFVDTFNGSRIAANLLAQGFMQQGIEPDAVTIQNAAGQFASWSAGQWQTQSLEVQAPSGSTGQQISMVGLVMSGMMLFFVFFTGFFGAETIVKEDEEGTLARLFTTPTPRSTILAGKFLAVFFMLAVQLIVLLVVSGLVFGINWGQPLTIILMLLGTVVSAAGFGILVMSFIRNTRQSGPVVGGVMTITGMLGGLFTVGVQNLPAFYDYITLATPQGWAIKGWRTALSGEGPGAVLLPLLVLLATGALLFALGVRLFRKRFA